MHLFFFGNVLKNCSKTDIVYVVIKIGGKYV